MNMFKPTTATTPEQYLEALSEPRKAEMQLLHAFIQKTVPHLKPLIRSGMIGYGTYHYRYASGKEGDWSLIALASQKKYISIYICSVTDGIYLPETYKNELPKASIGKSCIRFRYLKDINLSILSEIILKAVHIGGAGEIR